jgi:hypothetical protein
MIGIGLAAFALVMVVSYLVAKPFLAPEVVGRRSAQVLEDRARAISQITDLEMEFQTGKLAAEEYESLRADRLGELELAEATLARLEDELRAGELRHGDDVGVSASGDDDEADETDETDEADEADEADELERRIETRRRALADSGCPRCSAAADVSDRFCRSCGAPLEAAETR